MMRTVCVALVLLLAGCATAPVPTPAPMFDLRAAVQAVRAAGEAESTELDVQPLRDPEVGDLREQAVAHEAAGRLDAAARALDEALRIGPLDPVVLQERAELALLQGRLADALDHASRSHAAGPRVGPLCRRQHEVRVQVALAEAAAGDAAAPARAEAARRDRAACTVAPAPRY